MRFPSSLAALLAACALAAAVASHAQTAPGSKQGGRKPAAAPAGRQKRPSADPRSLIPGVGGIAPSRPATGGALPQGLGPGPAAVSGSLPGLSGTRTTGLRATASNPLLLGVDAVWGRAGGRAGWDRDNLAWAHRVAQTLRASKAPLLRINIDWASIEKTRGSYDFADTDRFVRFCAGLNVQIVATIGTAPAWSTDNSADVLRLFKKKAAESLLSARAPRPVYLPELGKFARACALRYKDQIHRWEFWPEPDGNGMPVVARDGAGRPIDIQFGGDPRTYTDMLKVFATNVRAANPSAQVAVGGLADARPTVGTRFLGSLYANGAKAYFDAVALHSYSDKTPVAADWIDAIHEAMVHSGDNGKPVWLTAWGWPTGPSFPELQQARWVREGLAAMSARPFIGLACYHALNDWRTNESDAASVMPYGLVGANLTPKPALAEFAKAAAGEMLRGSEMAQVELIGATRAAEPGSPAPQRVNVKIDVDRVGAALPPVWQSLSQAYELNGPKLLEESVPRLSAIGARLVRIDPFPDPDCVAPAPEGTSPASFDPGRVNWSYTDRMVEAIVLAGAKPMFCFATMPTALSSPNANPRTPRDPAEWSAFVRAIVKRYNQERRVGIVYWELGSRPNEGDLSLPEYLRLYDQFAQAVTGADPKALVGGPGVATGVTEWASALADHCSRNGVPLGFVSWQAYDVTPVAAAAQVRELRDRLAASPATKGAEILISEWNVSEVPTPQHDGVAGALYALSFAEQLSSVGPVRACFRQVRDGADVRRVGARFTGRWGLLANDGTPKAVYNAFKLLSRMSGARLKAETDDTGVRVLASRGNTAVRALLWTGPHSSAPAPDELPVHLQVRGLPWRGLTRGTLWILHESLGNGVATTLRSELRPAGGFQVAGPDADLVLAIPAGGVVLAELEPSTTSLRVALSTKDYTVYAGATFRIEATLRNTGTNRASFSPKLTSTDASLLPAGSVGRTTTLAPGESLATHYEVTVPSASPLGQEAFELACGEARSCVQVQVAAPVSAKLSAPRADVKAPDTAPDSLDGTATIGVVLTNRSAARTSAKLVYGSTSQTVSINPKSNASAVVSLVPPSNQPGNYLMPVRVMVGDRADTAIDVAVGVPALCHHTKTTPRIDAELSEWVDAYAMRLDRAEQVKEKKWGGPADLSAQIMTMWDERYFYIAGTVTDDVTSPAYPVDRLWMGDSLQFAIDARRAAAYGQTGYGDDDHEFVLGMGPLRPVLSRLAGPKSKSLGTVQGAQVAVRRVGTRTLYEAAIPWAEIAPAAPKDGAVIGFSIIVNDNDGKGRGYIELTPGIGTVKEPGKFLGLRLVKP